MLKSICLLLAISTCVYSRDSSAILSRLFKKSNPQASPLILVLDKNSLKPLVQDKSYASAQKSADEAEDSLRDLLDQLVQKSQSKSYAAPNNYHQSKDRNVNRPRQSYDYNYNDYKERNAVRPPIYKSLLSLRNSLRCGARNECQDECSLNYRGAKEKKCAIQCKIEFECDEPIKPKKACENCEMDYEACDDSDEQCGEPESRSGSTKGDLVVTEKPGCTRC